MYVVSDGFGRRMEFATIAEALEFAAVCLSHGESVSIYPPPRFALSSPRLRTCERSAKKMKNNS